MSNAKPTGAFAFLNAMPSKVSKIGGRRVQLASTSPDVPGEWLDVPELPGQLLQLPSTHHQMDGPLAELVDDPTFLLVDMYRALTCPAGPFSTNFFDLKPLDFKKGANCA